MNKKGVYFLSITINNFRCFLGEATLNLSKNGVWNRWTVILGDNATGKTSILQLLSGFENGEFTSEDDEYAPKGFSHRYAVPSNLDVKRGTVSAVVNVKGIEEDPLEMGVMDSSDYMGRIHHYSQLKDLICYGYGANRFMSTIALAKSESENSETLFDEDARLINAEEWLLQIDYAASKESEIKKYAVLKRIQVEKVLKHLLPDIGGIRFTTPTKANLKSTVEFKTPYGWVTIHQLSLGYKTMVAWMVDLAARLFERYPDSENPLAEPAIVLVDEIDLHLHPKWQRKIFDHLDSLFPKTQFIVTAHSPLVVQSAPKDANIVLLRREGNHVVIDQDIDSVNSWRLDQILTSDLFGLDSARGGETEDLLQERKKLLQKKRLTVKEKKRLEELNAYAHNLPSAESKTDIKAMEIIRRAAESLQTKGK